MMTYLQYFIPLVVGSKLATGQLISAAATQSTGWNSSFELSPEQVKLAKLTGDMKTIVNTIVQFDRSQLANGDAHEDDFYNIQNLPKDQWPTEPGEAVKVQEFTDPSPFSIPAKTAISRIVYSTTDINGTLVPASAYILWPYHPRAIRGRNKASGSSAPVVLWTHGTSGWYANGAPSTHRGLFYADIVPFALAEAGYAVIAPDYAGLGVDSSWDGTHVSHQYFVREAGAHDALNSLRAARTSFSKRLSTDYVVMGHSQGGAIAKDLDQIYPSFSLSDWFTPLGIDRIKLLNQVEGSQMVTFAMFDPDKLLLKPDWHETSYAKHFEKLANPGHMPFKGPVLLVHGTGDTTVPFNTTTTIAKETCKEYPGDLEVLVVPKGSHFSAMSAAQQTWLRWIEDRFEHRPVAKHGCVESKLESFLPLGHYQGLGNSFLQWAGEPKWAYELPTAL
ncbi:hypothetical protein N8T08_008258 [Aspergillus melleus]|uniref:Uncharacterized protein n=1 Tax=Aspergillus melleus TaxID=138277 RepID=A0ACC3AWA5_9EURO|nr:hypothetical protein N8T08_008258 [Aspergillus melleus]